MIMVKFHIHALERLAERDATDEEVIATVQKVNPSLQNTAGSALGAIFIMMLSREIDNMQQNRLKLMPLKMVMTCW